MRSEIKALRDLPALGTGVLAGSEKILADNGTADGTITASQLATLARNGVRLTSEQVALNDVTGLGSALAGKMDAAVGVDIAALAATVSGQAETIAGKMDVGAAAGFASATAFAAVKFRTDQCIAAEQLSLRSSTAPSHQLPHAQGYFALYAVPHTGMGPTGAYGMEIWVSNRHGDRVLIATLPPY